MEEEVVGLDSSKQESFIEVEVSEKLMANTELGRQDL